jgi:hypothetical protein
MPRGLAAQIERELRNKRPEHFVDKLSLVDFYASLECAAGVVGQQSRQSVENATWSRGEGFAGADRQRHR